MDRMKKKYYQVKSPKVSPLLYSDSGYVVNVVPVMSSTTVKIWKGDFFFIRIYLLTGRVKTGAGWNCEAAAISTRQSPLRS